MAHIAENNLKKSALFFGLIESEYKRGVKNSGDMLSEIEKLLESEYRKMEIIKDFHHAKSHILKKFGR